VVGGLGAGLNMHYFSNACWGLGQWDISAAMIFVSLAVLVSPSIRPLWVKAALAGLSIGMTVMEGFDAGAIMSLYAGIFIVFYFLITARDPVKAVPKTIGSGILVVLFALLISASTIYTLIGSTFTENASTGKTETEKKEHWIFLTTYSFPKMETLRLIIPGLFGYRLQEFMTDTNKSSAYWGTIAEDYRVAELESGSKAARAQGAADLGIANPEVVKILSGEDTPTRDKIMESVKSQLPRRHSGSGDYVGELICLMAFFALFNSWRRIDSPYSKNERQAIWFFGIAALFSLLAAWGRYGSVYQFIAPLPFLRNIRNPIKFLHPLNVCMIILSGYGMEALHRCYMRSAPKRPGWWKRASNFDKGWIYGTLAVLAAAVLGLVILNSSKKDLVQHIQRGGFSEEQAPQMAGFCIQEVLLFVLFFAASVGVIIGILSGNFTGRRAIWAWIFLGAITVVDISRADAPWVRYLRLQGESVQHEPGRRFPAARSLGAPGGVGTALACRGRIMTSAGSEPTFLAVSAIGGWRMITWPTTSRRLEIDQAPRLPDLDRNFLGDFSPRGPSRI
jgi:hypothetical protein